MLYSTDLKVTDQTFRLFNIWRKKSVHAHSFHDNQIATLTRKLTTKMMVNGMLDNVLDKIR